MNRIPKKYVAPAIVLLMVALLLPARLQAEEYTVDPARSELAVQLFKAGIAAALAHDHIIRAAKFTGEISYDPERISTGSIRIEARADSLKADEPAIRKKYGLPGSLRDADRRRIQSTMESSRQMDVASYPAMSFQATRAEKQSEGRYFVTGDLMLHGTTRSVTFPITVTRKDENVRGRASFAFKQSDFGIEPYGAFLGTVRIKDEALLHVDLLATPQ
jgi:polyisoprenoid-binding protein YceI